MITEILSVAAVAGGAYLLSKNDKESETDGKSGGSNDDVILDDSTGTSDEPDVDTEPETDDPTTDDEGTTVDTSDPRNRELYFGDKTQGYDPFYDYTGSSFDKLSLNALTYVPPTMGQALRARLIAPAILSTGEMSLSGDFKNGLEFDPDLLAHEYKNSNGEKLWHFAAKRLRTRHIAFVLEVFNPFEEEAQLQKIVFNDIKIGNTRCMAVHKHYPIGDSELKLSVYASDCFHSVRELRAMDENGVKKLRYHQYEYNPFTGYGYDNLENVRKGWEEYNVKDRHYCTIPARSSVFIKISLPLINYDSALLSWFNMSDFVKVERKSSGAIKKIEWKLKDFAERWGMTDKNFYATNGNGRGIGNICFYDTNPAPSLRNENLKMKITLYSDEKNYIPKDDLAGRPARSEYGATFDLRLMRGHRPQSFTYKWEDSYMGDANMFPTETNNSGEKYVGWKVLRPQEEEFQLETGFDLFQKSQNYVSSNNENDDLSETINWENGSRHDLLIESYGLKTTKN